MVAIAGAESSWVNNCPGDFGLGGPTSGDGATSWGLWQIHNANSDLLIQFTGSTSPDTWEQWLFVPANNAQVALAIYNRQGFRAWSTYNSGAYLNYTTDAHNALSGVPLTGISSPTSPTAFASPYSNLIIPATNFEVVAGTQAQGNVLYGRRYRILVTRQGDPNPFITGTIGGVPITGVAGEDTATQGQSLVNPLTPTTALDVSQLHCQFSLTVTMITAPQWSTVKIYNLSPETENTIIQEGYTIIIEAGYIGTQYGQIYQGEIVQCLRDKPDAATYTLTLVCMNAQQFQTYGALIGTLTRGQNARSQIGYIASANSVPTQLGKLTSDFSQTQLTRGKSYFGKANKYLRQLAQSENAAYYLENGQVNFIKMTDLPTDEVVDLTPNTGLIGVPAQNNYGATIKMLLNPAIKIGSIVHVDNSLIANQEYNQGSAIYQLDQSGLYRVIQYNIEADSRGQAWYTTVETCTQAGVQPSMITSSAQSPY
jgi:hypothetical protein